MRKYFFVFLINLLLYRNLESYCQTITVFQDDSLLMRSYTCKTDIDLTTNYRVLPYIDFKETLPNGSYILLRRNKKDSLLEGISKDVVMKGTFKDSLREGRFEFYSQHKKKKSNESYLSIIYNYKKGQLDGYYSAFNSQGKIDEGYYTDGRRNGFFVSYNNDGSIGSIELFKNDSLSEWVKYGQNGILEKGSIDNNNRLKEYKFFDLQGGLAISAFFQNYTLHKVIEYHHNGFVKKEMEGVFEDSWRSGRFNPILFSSLTLIKGTIKNYDEEGKIINVEKK